MIRKKETVLREGMQGVWRFRLGLIRCLAGLKKDRRNDYEHCGGRDSAGFYTDESGKEGS
jgi:hypothetical protein